MAERDNTSPNTDTSEKVSDETILKIAKEITVKFIEVGRVTPTTFAAAFTHIYSTLDKTVRGDKS